MSLFGWIFRSRRRRPVSWRLRSSNSKKNHQHHNQHSNQQYQQHQQQEKTQKRNSDRVIIVDDNHTPALSSTTKPVAGIDNCCSTKRNKNSIHADNNNNGNSIDHNDEDLLFQCIQTALLATPPSSCRRRESRQSRPRFTIIKNTTPTLNPIPTKRWSTGMLLVDFEEFDHFYYRTEKQKQLPQTPPIRPLPSPSLLSTTTTETTIITSNIIGDSHQVDQFNNNDNDNKNKNSNNNKTTVMGQVTSLQLPVIQRNPTVARRHRSSRVQSIPPTCGYHFLNSIPEIVENNNSIAAASQKPSSSTPSPPLNLI